MHPYGTITTTNGTVLEALPLPILGVVERRVQLPEEPRPDRRANVRFPLNLEVRSVSHRRKPVKTRLGNIIDISSSGLRFAAEGPLKAGLKLDVAIDWPVLLDGRVQLQLIVTGVVVWSSETETALQIQHSDFKTRRVGLSAVLPQQSDDPSAASIKGVNADTVRSLLAGWPKRTG
jgi:PilZ domain